LAGAKQGGLFARLGKWWLVIVAVVVVAVVAIVYSTMSTPPERDLGQTALVTRGPLTVAITESGELETQVVSRVSNELPWPVVILDLQPEGTYVRKDKDVIIKFECKDLADAIDRQLLSLASAQSSHTQAEQKLELTKEETAYNVGNAEQAVSDAKADLERYLEADWPTEHKNAESDVELAIKDLEIAKARLTFKEDVNSKPELKSPYSGSEIQSDKLTVARLTRTVDQAQSRLHVLTAYDYPRRKQQLETAVKDRQLQLKRTKLSASSAVMSDEAWLRDRETTLKKNQEQLDDLREKERKLTVTADRDGLVVYTPGGQGWRRRNDIALEVGAKIPENMQLMIIPDMGTLRVRTRVYESMIDQVKVGQKGFVKLEGRPGEVFDATIYEVSTLPDTSNWWSPDVKVFNVYLRLDQAIENLKPGMTCQVEVLLRELDAQTISVPVATVFSHQDENYVWRVTGGEAVKHTVKIGLTSQTRVQILEGLQEGDVLLLTEPKGTPVDTSGVEGKDKKLQSTTQPTTQPTSGPADELEDEPTSQPTEEPTTQPAENHEPLATRLRGTTRYVGQASHMVWRDNSLTSAYCRHENDIRSVSPRSIETTLSNVMCDFTVTHRKPWWLVAGG